MVNCGGQLVRPGAGAVGGVVVRDEDVGLGHRLAQPRRDRADVLQLVVGRDDHQDPAETGVGVRVLCHVVVPLTSRTQGYWAACRGDRLVGDPIRHAPFPPSSAVHRLNKEHIVPGIQRHLTLRFLAAPMDGNTEGRVEAAFVLEWIDKAGYAAAVAWSGQYSRVTAYVGNVRFSRPVCWSATWSRCRRASSTPDGPRCTSSAPFPAGRRDRRRGPSRASAWMVFVATDENGHPSEVPAFEPTDDWEREQQQIAVRRINGRREIEADMADQVYTEETSPRCAGRCGSWPSRRM